MKKLILGLSAVALSVGLLSALVASEKSYASETVSANEQVKELFKDYYNGSSYIKNSSIKFDSAKFGELATYFHAGSTVLDRTTYYHGNELWMSRGTEGAGYSYYGSAANNGGVTNATAETALVTPANPKVVLTGEGKESMEDYYVTMKDLMVDSFFYEENTWALSEGVYKTENADIMDKFRLFTAPCFLNYEEDGDKLEHYLTLSKATVTKSGDGLVLSLYVDGTDSGKVVGEADSEGDYLLSQATVSYEADVWDGTTVSTSLEGAGTAADPYRISSGADLAYFEQQVDGGTVKAANLAGKYYKLTKNIDLNGANFMIGCYPGWGSRVGFGGVFDGNNHSVRGLKLSNTSGTGAALFGSIEKGGTLKNLSVYGTVEGKSTIGGLSSYAYGTLENCMNFATVSQVGSGGSGYGTAGGVIGNGESGSSLIKNCVNYGKVSGDSFILGGIVGQNTEPVENNTNYGEVTASTEHAGGIVGQAGNNVVGNVNKGTVNGPTAAGGIVGKVGYSQTVDKVLTYYSPKIEESHNYGTINGTTERTGGIAGIIFNGTVTDCVNNGDLRLETDWGKFGASYLVHTNSGTVTNCVNNAKAYKVDGTEYTFAS